MIYRYRGLMIHREPSIEQVKQNVWEQLVLQVKQVTTSNNDTECSSVAAGKPGIVWT